ncbi:MAG: ferredoxin [Parasphingorhabdus sp.]|jgi:ferredoxin
MTQDVSVNATARAAAAKAVDTLKFTATALIEYQSHGRVLIIGPHETATAALACLAENLNGTILQTDYAEDPDHVTIPLAERNIAISGHLGAFVITLGEKGSLTFETLSADMILDLCAIPLLDMPIKPPGYLASGNDFFSIEVNASELADMTGSFDKPRYFEYDSQICAHSRSGQPGCSRCLDSCPTGAIQSLGEMIEVDPYLCQGGGVCATVCPTGAIRYVYPDLKDQLTRLRLLIHTYLDHHGEKPCVIFISEAEAEQFELVADNVLLMPVEELASVGLETWLSALAYGANQVVLAGASVPETVSGWLDQQIDIAWAILSTFDIPEQAIRRIPDVSRHNAPGIEWQPANRASYAGLNDKRNMLYAAIDALANGQRNKITELPEGAPLGRIHVDGDLCTLCMACTSVCPSHAIVAGGEKPALLFHEVNCVQCGICEQACPESAITLQPRLNLDIDERRRGIVVNEQKPFNCVVCGKPFATRNIIDTMLGKLADHPMFQSERAKKRLMMCDDCRVVDVVQDDDMMNPTR